MYRVQLRGSEISEILSRGTEIEFGVWDLNMAGLCMGRDN